jgi:hypothetical protein
MLKSSATSPYGSNLRVIALIDSDGMVMFARINDIAKGKENEKSRFVF